MDIVILGAGKIGSGIAKNLVNQNYNITVVDVDAEKLHSLQSDFDLATVIGSASSPETLSKAGVTKNTVVLAVTHLDEINLIACQLSKNLFSAKRTICRISNKAYLGCMDVLGGYVDIPISPVSEITTHLLELIEHPGTEQIESFVGGEVKLVSVKAKKDGMLVNRALKNIKNDLPNVKASVTAIYRKSKPIIPDEDTVIKEGDEVYFLAKRDDVDAVISEIRNQGEKHKRVMIVGGGKIGFELARNIEDKLRLKLIEPDKDRCEFLSTELKKTIVLRGNGSDEDLLKTENIEKIDLFCAVTNDDEANIMSAFLAKKLGVKKTIIILNNYSYINSLPKGFVDVALSPQRLTVSMVLQHLYTSDVTQEVILKMASGVEAIAGVVHKNSHTESYIGKPIRSLPLPSGSSVGAIYRNNDLLTPATTNELVLQELDRLIIFISSKTNKEEITKLFLN
ncbi:MAG: Trk system potassium transporter TrkA [Gammaproteobacteria bacterium]